MTGPRILFLYSGLGVGGAERQLALLAPGLRDRGFEPRVATLRIAGPNLEALRAAGIPVTHVAMRSRHDLRGATRAYALWRERPEIVFTSSIDAQVLGHVIARRARAAHVTAEHGGSGIRRPSHHRIAARLVAPRVDRVLAVTESQRPDLRQLGYREEAIRVIPNGVPEPHLRRDRSEVRRELGLSESDVVAVLVAALRPEKRADRFVEAVAQAHSSDPRIRGLVVGQGPELDEIRTRGAASDGAVLVLGERHDVAELMASSDAICLTSDVEGLPMTALEAMALSKPVIGTDVGGMRDAVAPGETGWLVPAQADAVARALVELATDAERASGFGRSGNRRFQERFTIERMADDYAAMLTEALAERSRPRGAR